MDLKERSPSFLQVREPNSISGNGSSVTHKMKFQPMTTSQILKSLNMYLPTEKAPSAKKFSMKPVRTAELNLDEFITKSPKIPARNVRKQLWSTQKCTGDKSDNDKLRRVTVMKPVRESLKKSIYSRPSLMQSKNCTTKNQSKCLSIDDTLPLMDMEQFTVTKIKRTLYSAPQSKPSNQRKTTSHINVNKIPIVSSFPRKIAKPIPSIMITPIEKSVKKSVNEKACDSNPKSESEKKEDKIDLIFKKLLDIEEQISLFKPLLCSITTHLGIGTPLDLFAKNKGQTQKPEEIRQISTSNNDKTELSSSCFKRDVSSTTTINDYINNTAFQEKVYKLSPFIINQTSNVINEENNAEPKLSDGTSKVTSNNHLDKIEKDTFKKSETTKLKFSTSKVTTNNHMDKIEKNTITEPETMKLLPSTSKVTTNNRLELETNKKDTITEPETMKLKLSPCPSKVTTNNLLELEKNKNVTITETKFIKFNLSPSHLKVTTNKKDTLKESNKNSEEPIIINNNNSNNNNNNNNDENLKDIPPSTPNNQERNSIKLEDIFTPKTDKMNTKTESTIKLKKTWITQFEQLENKLLNNSNVSINLNSSPDISPVQPFQIDQIVNDDDDYDTTNQLTTIKKSKSTSNLVESKTSHRKNILFKSRDTDSLTESICVYNALRDELPKFLSTPVNNANKTVSFITPSVQGNEKKLISRRVQEQLLRLNDF